MINFNKSFQLQFIKAQSKLDKFEFSDLLFVKEYQKAVLAYYQIILEMIIYGIIDNIGGNVSQLKKSIEINQDELNNFFKASHFHEDEFLLIKSILSEIRKKIIYNKKLWEKFKIGNFEKIEPIKLSKKFPYNTKGKKIEQKDWESLHKDIKQYLKKSDIEDELSLRGILFGHVIRLMGDDKISIEEQRKKSWDQIMQMYKIPINNKAEIKRRFSPKEQETLKYVKNHTGQYLSITNGNLKNKLMKMLRVQVSLAIEQRIGAQELSQRLFSLDTLRKDPKIKNIKLQDITNMQKYYDMVAMTELSFALNEGYLASVRDKKPNIIYFRFVKSPKQLGLKTGGKTCKQCSEWEGKIVKWVEKAPKNNSDKTKDKNADFLIWQGKTNVDRKKLWICCPVHPRCQHRWNIVNI